MTRSVVAICDVPDVIPNTSPFLYETLNIYLNKDISANWLFGSSEEKIQHNPKTFFGTTRYDQMSKKLFGKGLRFLMLRIPCQIEFTTLRNFLY